MPSDAVEVFISYAHEDEELRKDLNKHLKSLEREGLIKTWNDRDMTAGSEWKQEINKRLESAGIILLSISADFINSDYCFDVEMTRALARHNDENALVIPVILRACAWKNLPFGCLNALPENGTPILTNHRKDEALTEVAEGIRKAIGSFKGSPTTKEPIPQLPSSQLFDAGISFTLRNILFLSANPKNSNRDSREREILKIEHALGNATLKRKEKGENNPLYNPSINQPIATTSDISRLLVTVKPYIIQISGFENELSKLILEDSPGSNRNESVKSLILDLFQNNSLDTHCVVLNGCYLETQAREIVQYVDFIIGINQSLSEELVLIYLDEFYFCLGLGRTVTDAHEAGCHRLTLLQLNEIKMPILLSKKEETYRRSLEKALTVINEAIEKDVTNASRWNQKGSLLQRLHLSEDAAEAYEKAAFLEPENPKIREDQGDDFEQSGEHKEAEAAYSKALELSEEKDYKILWKKGKAQARSGQYISAIYSYSEVLKLEPPSPDNYLIYREYGYIFEKAGRHVDSIAMYTKALQIQPKYRAANYERKWLYKKIYSRKVDNFPKLS